jgi:hypothetical protein
MGSGGEMFMVCIKKSFDVNVTLMAILVNLWPGVHPLEYVAKARETANLDPPAEGRWPHRGWLQII